MEALRAWVSAPPAPPWWAQPLWAGEPEPAHTPLLGCRDAGMLEGCRAAGLLLFATTLLLALAWCVRRRGGEPEPEPDGEPAPESEPVATSSPSGEAASDVVRRPPRSWNV